MDAFIEAFLDYSGLECGLSDNTLLNYGDDLRRFQAFCNSRKCTEWSAVSRELVTDFLADMRNKGLAPATISRRLVSVKLIFRYMLEEKLIDSDVTAVMDSARLGRDLPDIISEGDVEKLLNHVSGDDVYSIRNRAILELMYASGLRVSEVCNLTVDDMHFESDYLRCRGKGDKVRVVPFGKRAADAVRTYVESVRPVLGKDPAVRELFLSRRGAGLSRKTIWVIVQTVARDAGLDKKVHPHSLRHAFASHLLANDAPLRVIQEMLGHADIGTTQIYTHVDKARLKTVHNQHHPRA